MLMNINKKISDFIIDRMNYCEEHNIQYTWVKPFNINGCRYPCNYTNQIPYRGINRLLDNNEYLTFNQIAELNKNNPDKFYHIRKGSKGYPIVFFKFIEDLDSDGCIQYNANGEVKMKPILRYYNVYSREDVVCGDENLPSRFPVKRFTHDEIDQISKREVQRFNSLMKYYCHKNGFDLQIISDGTTAYFSPKERSIHVPNMFNFQSAFDYIHTVSHEMIHSTGLFTRFSESGISDRESYAKEELIAEIGANFISSQFRVLPSDTINKDNNIAYIQFWRSFIQKNDTKSILLSSAQAAQKACDTVLFDQLRTQILSEISSNPAFYDTAPDFMKYDIDFARAALEENPLVLNLIPYEVREELNDELHETKEQEDHSFDFLDEER